MKQLKTPVIFRFDPEYNEVIAFSPHTYEPERSCYEIGCYTHIGQHGFADIAYYLKTKKATPEQYAPLLSELIEIGYDNIQIRQRMSYRPVNF